MNDVVRPPVDGMALPANGSKMASRIAQMDWSATPLGPPKFWPLPLRTLLGVMLGSNQPMFVAWGPERTLIYNDPYAEILARKHPDALGCDFLDVWHEIRADLLPIVEQAYRGEPVQMDDILLLMERRGHQEEAHFAFSYTPVRDEAGAIAGFFCACQEITGQVLAERQLRQSEARLRGVLEGMGEAFGLLDHDFRILTFNEAALQLETRPVEEIIGRSHWDVYPGSEDSEIGRLYKRAMVGKQPVALEHCYTWEDGTARWLEMRAYPVPEGLAVFWRDISERKKAEAALRESEARLSFLDRLSAETSGLADADAVLATITRLVGEHLSVSVCAYADMDEDGDGFTVRGDWAAPGATSIVGHYSLAAFGKLAVQNLSAGRPLVLNDTQRELPPEEAATYRSIGLAATICMPLVKEGRLAALMAIHDRVPRVWAEEELALVREITARSWAHVERVGALAELREREGQFRAFAQAVPSHVWAAHPDGALYWFNDQVYAYCGEAPGSLDGTEWARIVHPEDVPSAAVTWAHAVAAGEVYETEFRIRRADGCYRWFLVRAEPVWTADGAISTWVGTNTDIHDRRSAEEALRELNETLEARVAERTADRDRMWRLTTDIMLVARFDGEIAAINPAWQRLLGWSEDELLGRAFFDFVHPDDLAATVAEAGRLSEGVTTFRFENRYQAKDGSYRWVSWIAVPDEGLIHAVGRDITAEKEKQAELERAQEALRQSQKMDAVGQLTGGIAHDFNNLLAGISGSLELMATRISQGRHADVERYLAAAQGAARRAAALTHRLLAFSRRQTLAPKVTDINTLVTGMEELIRRTVGPEIVVESVTGSDIWAVEIDPNQLENALLNLAINARDAMPDGGKITIETANRWMDARTAREQELSPGQYVSLCVSDTGTGMTPEVIARAFDPFFTTKPIGMGTGLGLSMVYGFARQSGGQVRIYSEVGQGTTICLYLPRYLGGEDAQEDGWETNASIPTGAGETVLVIDDEPVVRMLVVDVLEELGYSALEAADGAEGLKVLESKARVDLLVTDVGLPGGLNGRQVADAARVLRPKLKVLFITGYAENAVISHGHLDPGMHVVTKPFQVEDLGRRIRAILTEE
jgi:PAS domain S-box-containing protein